MDNISRVDLNLLVVLEAIYAEGGVTRAAGKLNLTQPAISHALGRLRDLFGDPLFVRQGRALAPTPLTRSLIEPLRRSLQSLGAVLTEAGRFDPQSSEASFAIAVRDPVEVLVLPRLMQGLSSSAPGVDLRFVQARRRDLEAALGAGNLDLAIDVLLPLSDNVRRQQVAADRLAVVARKGHPAIAAGFSLPDYLGLEHVMVTSRRKGPGLEDLGLARQGLKRRVRLRCRNYLAAFRVVQQSDLLLTVPERYAAALNHGLDNQILPLPFQTPTLDLYLYWHVAVDADPANRWLRGLVQQTFAGYDEVSPKRARK